MSEGRPSILCVTSELPWPLDTGGHLRTFHLLHALVGDFSVRLVTAVPWNRQDGLGIEAVNRAGISVRPASVRRRTIAGEARRGLAALLHGEPYVLYRRHDRPEVRAALRSEVAREPPAILYLDHLDSFQFAGEAPHIPMVLDLHNVYSLLVRREAAEPARSWIARRYLAREARLLDRLETLAVRRAAAVFSVSAQEQAHFSALRGGHVRLIPNGVDCDQYASLPTGRSSAPPNVLLIGTLSWPPNAAAAKFLAKEVLPLVRRRVPDATLTIVGRNPGPAVKALSQTAGVRVVGNVPDIVPYLRDARALAVPLEAGGGTRLKILEAFAAGLPVVSTPIGCEGLAGVHGQELLIASRTEFATAVSSVLADAVLGEALATRARVLAREQYDWRVIGRAVRAALHSIQLSGSDALGAGRP